MKNVAHADPAKTWPSWVRACSICPNLSLLGEAKCLYGENWLAPQGHPTFKESDPPPRVTLLPTQLCNFSCKRFAAIYKEMYGVARYGG